VPNSLNKLTFYEIKTITDFNSWVKQFTGSFKKHREAEQLKTLAKYNYHLSFLTGKFYYSKKPLDDIIIKVEDPKFSKGAIEDLKIRNSTVVHYLVDKKHKIQHRNVFDT
jgi:hypothetical protein